jgi:hypothetical protein
VLVDVYIIIVMHFNQVFYPQWWLESVGYFNNKPNPDPEAILFASNPAAEGQEEGAFVVQTVSLSSFILACFVCAVVFGASGYYVGKKETNGGMIDQFSNSVALKSKDHHVFSLSSSPRGAYSTINSEDL